MLYVYSPIEWIMKNPNAGIDIKVKYFSLEISKELKMLQAISYRLFTQYDILISPNNLLSIFKGYVIDSAILKVIESKEFTEWFEFFEDRVEITDNIKHPTGIIANVENYAKANGKIEYKEVIWDDEPHKVIDKYIPNNESTIVVPIIDHATLLQEKGKTTYECIKTLSSQHLIKMKNVYKYSPVLIQQQSADSTSQQFSSRGENILDKVRPTREGLAGCRDSGQDCSLMLGIFSPYKYKEESYEGWDLTRLRDYHREISILLNRSGKSNASIQMYFNGACSFFKELPQQPIQDVYNFVNKYRQIEESYTKQE